MREASLYYRSQRFKMVIDNINNQNRNNQNRNNQNLNNQNLNNQNLNNQNLNNLYRNNQNRNNQNLNNQNLNLRNLNLRSLNYNQMEALANSMRKYRVKRRRSLSDMLIPHTYIFTADWSTVDYSSFDYETTNYQAHFAASGDMEFKRLQNSYFFNMNYRKYDVNTSSNEADRTDYIASFDTYTKFSNRDRLNFHAKYMIKESDGDDTQHLNMNADFSSDFDFHRKKWHYFVRADYERELSPGDSYRFNLATDFSSGTTVGRVNINYNFGGVYSMASQSEEGYGLYGRVGMSTYLRKNLALTASSGVTWSRNSHAFNASIGTRYSPYRGLLFRGRYSFSIGNSKTGDLDEWRRRLSHTADLGANAYFYRITYRTLFLFRWRSDGSGHSEEWRWENSFSRVFLNRVSAVLGSTLTLSKASNNDDYRKHIRIYTSLGYKPWRRISLRAFAAYSR
jgi:hypothetical protein